MRRTTNQPEMYFAECDLLATLGTELTTCCAGHFQLYTIRRSTDLSDNCTAAFATIVRWCSCIKSQSPLLDQKRSRMPHTQAILRTNRATTRHHSSPQAYIHLPRKVVTSLCHALGNERSVEKCLQLCLYLTIMSTPNRR
jgi:hypothetical protein